MGEEEKNIEKLFRDRFEDFKVEPSKGLWTRIRWKLAIREFFNFSSTRFNAWYFLAGGGLVLGLLLIDYESSEPEMEELIGLTITEELIPLKSQVFAENRIDVNISEVVSEETVLDLFEEESEIPEIMESEADPEISDIVIQETSVDPDSIENVSTGLAPDEVMAEKVEDSLPYADFDFTPDTGCNNLRVQFRNYSENAVSFRWLFGDGGSSNEKEPSWFYDKPGTYNVTLEARGADASSDRTHATIEIKPEPVAQFEVSANGDSGFGRTVYFYNYSQNAEKYVWDFGDGNHSTDINPIHTYMEPGNFNVSLLAVSPYGCTDEMMMDNILSEEEYFIIFPNAFRPDNIGPADGTYNPSEPVTKVFFPQYKGVAEYQLSIYNKSGQLLFETNNISTGWNGYYNDKLVSPEVYIWKAKGRFENGQPFVKAGDVTVVPY
ncbi:MAG: PKD domain-containing protein [bacterium]